MKQKKLIKVTNLFLVLIFILSISCSKDDSLIELTPKNIETVNFNEAISFLNLKNKAFAKNYNENFVTP